MNQNNPPHDPSGQAAGQAPGEGAAQAGANPYYQRVQEPAPDLDAAAPRLRSAEEQRLNRKALAFLGGIVLLLMLVALALYKQATAGKDEPVARDSKGDAVTVPKLPQVAEPVPPVAATPAEPIELVPPLPAHSGPVPLRTLERERDRGPTLMERRMASTGAGGDLGGQSGAGAGPPAGGDDYSKAMLAAIQAGNGQPPAADGPKRGPDVDNVSNASYINHPDALLVRGTYLRCILETRIITDVQGFTSCLVTEPVYSINGRSLLLPKGSKIYGSYGGGPSNDRVSVIWDRITTPNGIDVAMSSPGVDNLGGAGHPGHYSAHWGSRIASALMISLLSDAFKYAAAEHGPETTAISSNGFAVQSPYESATARTMERLANEALSENMRRRATVTINQGTVINVYVAQDVDFTDVLRRH